MEGRESRIGRISRRTLVRLWCSWWGNVGRRRGRRSSFGCLRGRCWSLIRWNTQWSWALVWWDSGCCWALVRWDRRSCWSLVRCRGSRPRSVGNLDRWARRAGRWADIVSWWLVRSRVIGFLVRILCRN